MGAKNDCTADRSEAYWTRAQDYGNRDGTVSAELARHALDDARVCAAVASAHALERIAEQLGMLIDATEHLREMLSEALPTAGRGP